MAIREGHIRVFRSKVTSGIWSVIGIRGLLLIHVPPELQNKLLTMK